VLSYLKFIEASVDIVSGERVSRTRRVIEERRRAMQEAMQELVKAGYKQEQVLDLLRLLLPRRLWHNVPLEVCECGGVEVVFYGDDLLREGLVRKIELRFKEPYLLSFIKKWIDEEGLPKALHWVLVLSKAAEPPKVEDELSKRIRERLAELKAMLDYIEEMRKRYLG
jgi:hypothetical protein